MGKYRIVTGRGKKKVLEAESFDDAVLKTFNTNKWVMCRKGEKGYNKANIKVQGQEEKTSQYFYMYRMHDKQPVNLYIAVQFLCNKVGIPISVLQQDKTKVCVRFQGENGLSVDIEADTLSVFQKKVQDQVENLKKNGIESDLVEKMVTLVQVIKLTE